MGGKGVGAPSYGISFVIIHIKRVILYCLVWAQEKSTFLTSDVYVPGHMYDVIV